MEEQLDAPIQLAKQRAPLLVYSTTTASVYVIDMKLDAHTFSARWRQLRPRPQTVQPLEIRVLSLQPLPNQPE